MARKLTRRKFIGEAGLGVFGFSIVPSWVVGGCTPPSDKINLGVIGLGKQGRILTGKFVGETRAQIVAGSDVWDSKRACYAEAVGERYAKLRGVSRYRAVDTYVDYGELLAREDVDAVVVATPDHWHAPQALDAIAAGKDVYCEKPLTNTVAAGRAMADAARESGTVFQVGSMQRSFGRFIRAKDLVRAGALGRVERVLVSVGDPARAYDLVPQPTPMGVDWNRWCGPAPLLGYHEDIAPPFVHAYPKWRLFAETGGGMLSDWGAHMFDVVQWCLDRDHTGPTRLLPPPDPGAVRGLRMRYADGVEVVHEDFGRGRAVRFIGSEGTLDVSREFLEADLTGLLPPLGELVGGAFGEDQGNHYEDWLAAIRSRGPTISPVEVGHRSATVCNVANIAYWLARPLTWDPVTETFPGDGEANAYLRRPRRDWASRAPG